MLKQLEKTHTNGEVKEWANFPPGIQLMNKIRGKKNLKTWDISVKNEKVFISI